ncbi:glycosyltransferase family 2 protein [Paenibacillus solani]|uniref:glycosyltransferase family 2 protein n=1 Tax=Paenibacillus solani TaxID=1705565 RepID=UPI003D2DC7AB
MIPAPYSSRRAKKRVSKRTRTETKRSRYKIEARIFKNRPISNGVIDYWKETAYAAGFQQAAQEVSKTTEIAPHIRVNESWNRWYHSVEPLPWTVYHAAATKFVEGYSKHSGIYLGNAVLLPTEKTVAAIVLVMNEKDTILKLLEQLHRLPLHEIIFVVNGSTDESFEIIRNQSKAIIVHSKHALGHDVGRAVGAKLADSEILLFLDGDLPILAEQLVPFIDAIKQGSDIALNDISPLIGMFSKRDYVTIVKEFINRSMGRADLGANSLTAVPHAIKKEAAQIIGYANLSVPPKAQVIALEKGLKINAPASVDVITKNRLRARNVGLRNAVSDLIIGDHIEALKTAFELKGSRLSFTDQIRQRQLTKM